METDRSSRNYVTQLLSSATTYTFIPILSCPGGDESLSKAAKLRSVRVRSEIDLWNATWMHFDVVVVDPLPKSRAMLIAGIT